MAVRRVNSEQGTCDGCKVEDEIGALTRCNSGASDYFGLAGLVVSRAWGHSVAVCSVASQRAVSGLLDALRSGIRRGPAEGEARRGQGPGALTARGVRRLQGRPRHFRAMGPLRRQAAGPREAELRSLEEVPEQQAPQPCLQRSPAGARARRWRLHQSSLLPEQQVEAPSTRPARRVSVQVWAVWARVSWRFPRGRWQTR